LGDEGAFSAGHHNRTLMATMIKHICGNVSLKLLLISIILLLYASAASALLLDVPLGDNLYDEVYEFVDRMIASGYATEFSKNTRPYSRGEVAKILIQLDKKIKDGSLKLSRVEAQKLNQYTQVFSDELQALGYSAQEHKSYLFQTQGEKHKFGFDFGLGENIISRLPVRRTQTGKQEAEENKRGYVTLFRPTVTGQIQDDFAFYTDLKVYYISGAQFPDIPKTEVRMGQPGKEVKTASLANYYIKTKLPWFELFLGYDNLHWGPGRHGALLLSKNPLPMDMIRLTARYYPVKFQSVTAKLGSNIDKKYLSAHRLELSLWDKLRLGVAETVIYGHRFETIYLNPVLIYIPKVFVTPTTEGGDDNVVISGDLDFTLLENLEFYGELLIDDAQPFSYSWRSWKNKFGLLLGGYWVDPFSLPDTDIRLEYTFVNQYAYTHRKPINVYTHFNSIIGHQIGGDADELWLNLKHWFTANLAMSLTYELERHGEWDVNKLDPQNPSGEGELPGEVEWEFLSGVTESTNSLSLGFSYAVVGRYFANVEYTTSWIKNVSNKLGENSTRHQFILNGSYRF
jgi:hypothetical protein